MIRVSLSGNVWIEDVAGAEFVLEVPAGTLAYYESSLNDLPPIDGDEPAEDEEETGTHFRVSHPGCPFIVCPGGYLDPIRINVVSPKSVLLYDETDGKWRYLDVKDAPRTIDRRRTIWQRLNNDD